MTENPAYGVVPLNIMTDNPAYGVVPLNAAADYEIPPFEEMVMTIRMKMAMMMTIIALILLIYMMTMMLMMLLGFHFFDAATRQQ